MICKPCGRAGDLKATGVGNADLFREMHAELVEQMKALHQECIGRNVDKDPPDCDCQHKVDR